MTVQSNADKVPEYLGKAIWGKNWRQHNRYIEISHYNELAVGFDQVADVGKRAETLATADARIARDFEEQKKAAGAEAKKTRRRRNYMAHAVV